MKFRHVSVALLVIIATVIFISDTGDAIAQNAVDRKGEFTLVEGNVKRKQLQEESWQQAHEKTGVLSGDRVRTLLRARAEMALADLDVIRLAPRTTIDIVKLYEETKEKKVETQINLKQGDIWGTVKSVNANSSFKVSSDFAGAAITGTIFRVKQDSAKEETKLKVYKGEVQISNALEKIESLSPTMIKPTQVEGPKEIPGPREVSVDEWLYIVKAMQEITIGGDGQVISAGSFSLTDSDENTEWVKWNQARDNQ